MVLISRSHLHIYANFCYKTDKDLKRVETGLVKLLRQSYTDLKLMVWEYIRQQAVGRVQESSVLLSTS